MQNASKQSGGRDTGLFRKQFFATRLSLTMVYMVLLAFFLVLSGSITRIAFSQKLDARFAHSPHQRMGPILLTAQIPNADDVRADLSQVLFGVGGVLTLLAGVVSYTLASLTIEPIQAAYEKQRQFLSDASHELRTPLAILQADLENERIGASEKALERINSHLEEVQRMNSLVGDVLLLSKTEAETSTPLPVSSVDVNVVTRHVCDRLLSLARRHDVPLSVEVFESPLIVLAHKDSLTRCLSNIVENAILYNCLLGTVTVTVRKEDDTACIDVVDTGMGIAEADVEKIFDRFYRGEKSRSRRTGGTGLGLSIAKSIVESFGGTITLHSVLRRGTTVNIRLPLQDAS